MVVNEPFALALRGLFLEPESEDGVLCFVKFPEIRQIQDKNFELVKRQSSQLSDKTNNFQIRLDPESSLDVVRLKMVGGWELEFQKLAQKNNLRPFPVNRLPARIRQFDCRSRIDKPQRFWRSVDAISGAELLVFELSDSLKKIRLRQKVYVLGLGFPIPFLT